MTALQKKIISHLPKEPQSLCGRKKTSTLIVVCFFLHVFTLQQSVREERGPRTGNAATATGSGVYWYVSLQHFYHWPNSVYNAWLTFYDLLSTITRWKMLILQKGFWKKALKANKTQTLWVYMHVCMCVWTHRLHKLKFFPLLHLLDLEHVLQRRIVKHLPVLTHLWISLLQRTDTSHLCHTKKKKTGVFGQRKNTSLYLMQLRLLLFGGNAEVFLQNWVVSLCLLIKLFLSLLAEMRGGRKQQNKKREICFRRRQKGTSKHEIYWICTIPKQLNFYIYAYSRKWPMKRQSSNSYKETVI